MSSSYSRTAWGEAKNGLVSADTYRQLDRRCYRSRCAQRHPGAAGGKPRSAVYAEHVHRRRGPWGPRRNRAQIGFTKCKLAEHSGRSNSVNGSVPDDIMQVQSRLIDLGYMIGPPDGLWGNKSRQALRAFKAANGIQADDKWDSEISAKLFSTQAARSPTRAAGSGGLSRQKVN